MQTEQTATAPPAAATGKPSAQAHASHAGEHGHHHHDMRSAPLRALTIALVLNAIMLVAEVIVGAITGSLAVWADAGHMLTDVGALALALVAQRVGRRAPTLNYTYGMGRVPVLGGLINAATLLVIVTLIARDAIERFVQPVAIDGLPVLVIGGIGLIVNVASAWYLHRCSDKSVNIRGAVLHLVADALGSVAVIGSAIVIMLTGWSAIDPLLSLVIAILILASSVPLLRDTLRIMLERAPSHVDIKALRAVLEADSRVSEIMDLHIWELNSREVVFTAILLTEATTDLEELTAHSDHLRHMLAEHEVDHVTIEWRADGMKPYHV